MKYCINNLDKDFKVYTLGGGVATLFEYDVIGFTDEGVIVNDPGSYKGLPKFIPNDKVYRTSYRIRLEPGTYRREYDCIILFPTNSHYEAVIEMHLDKELHDVCTDDWEGCNYHWADYTSWARIVACAYLNNAYTEESEYFDYEFPDTLEGFISECKRYSGYIKRTRWWSEVDVEDWDKLKPSEQDVIPELTSIWEEIKDDLKNEDICSDETLLYFVNTPDPFEVLE